jgi:hypothetical protein
MTMLANLTSLLHPHQLINLPAIEAIIPQARVCVF